MKAKSPVFSYDKAGSESPTGAPFAQKVADMISKKKDVVDDVYGLEQSAISSISSTQQTFSLAHHK